MILYVAADTPLRTVPWSPERPAFHVEPVDKNGTVPEVVRACAKPHVYEVGSSEKCACALDATVDRDSDDQLVRDDLVREVRAYLTEAASTSALELFPVTDGAVDAASPSRTFWPQTAAVEAFLFEPGERIHIEKRSAA